MNLLEQQNMVTFEQRTLANQLVSIISVTGVAIWSKTNFGPTGHHYP
jgi:hypothetical protein